MTLTPRSRARSGGFTLVELLLATAFFSFVLIFVISGFIQITRAYNKGFTVKRTQESARLALEDISRTLRTAPDSTQVTFLSKANGDAYNRLCIGSIAYAWNRFNEPVKETVTIAGAGAAAGFSLVRVPISGVCGESLSFPSGSEVDTLVDKDIAIQSFDVTSDGISFKLDLYMSTDSDFLSNAADDLLENPGAGKDNACRGTLTTNIVGTEFCDTVHLSTSVSLLQ